MLKAFVKDTAQLSRAMTRVADALTENVTAGVQVVTDRAAADLVFMHGVGYPETVENSTDLLNEDRDFALFLYCLKTTQRQRASDWIDVFRKAKVVWSYYDLAKLMADEDTPSSIIETLPLYCAPLGVGAPFTDPFDQVARDVGIMSSGFVSAPNSEAIEEVALAANSLGMRIVHLGPERVEGMNIPPLSNWRSALGIDDEDLASFYRRTKWVSGLRHVEGFEMPVLEGLACGARPIVFDRPDMRKWYEGHVVFVPECHGQELVDRLIEILKHDPEPVSAEERKRVLDFFNWKTVVREFWQRVEAAVDERVSA